MSTLSSLAEVILKSKSIYESYEPASFEVPERYGEDNENMLAHGDCLDFIKYLLNEKDMKGKVRLIYIDPPFLTKLKHEAVIKVPGSNENISVPAYEDQWENGELEYYKMLAVRLYAMRDLLSEDGAIWVHLDWHASHYVKIILDEIFGAKNFVNEIVWTYKSGGSTKRHFARKHDTLLYYSKSSSYFFKTQKEKSYNRGFKPYRFKGVEEFEDENGWYTMVNMKDVWSIDMVGRTSKERTGYATQKPVALLKRILESCSEEGDICADFFSGSGTLAAACSQMGRKFICCDGGTLATKMSIQRLSKEQAEFVVFFKKNDNIFKKYDDILIIDDIIDISAFINSKEGSEHAIDMWSIDYKFDGNTHKPERLFLRNKDDIETRIPISGSDNISIVFYDILGNRLHYVISKDNGLLVR